MACSAGYRIFNPLNGIAWLTDCKQSITLNETVFNLAFFWLVISGTAVLVSNRDKWQTFTPLLLILSIKNSDPWFTWIHNCFALPAESLTVALTDQLRETTLHQTTGTTTVQIYLERKVCRRSSNSKYDAASFSLYPHLCISLTMGLLYLALLPAHCWGF